MEQQVPVASWSVVEVKHPADSRISIFEISQGPELSELHSAVIYQITDELRVINGIAFVNDDAINTQLVGIASKYSSGLRKITENIITAPFNNDKNLAAIKQIGEFRGRFLQSIEALRGAGYAVLTPDVNPTSIEIRFNGNPSADQESLISSLSKVSTVVELVISRKSINSNQNRGKIRKFMWSLVGVQSGQSGTNDSRGATFYLQRLKEIADQGLAPGANTASAAARLKAFEESFVERESGVVKNTYMVSLGMAAIIGASIIISLCIFQFLLKQYFNFDPSIPGRYFYALVGACVGTWLSFCMRRVELDFYSLAKLEDDRVSPGLRLIFVIFLTLTLSFMLDSGFATISVGNYKLGLQPDVSAISAMLFGIVCGIAERTLSNTVLKRSERALGELPAVGAK
jgi:hypothetical protein